MIYLIILSIVFIIGLFIGTGIVEHLKNEHTTIHKEPTTKNKSVTNDNW